MFPPRLLSRAKQSGCLRKAGTGMGQVALVDDDQNNVIAAATDGHPAIFVRERNGVRVEDMVS